LYLPGKRNFVEKITRLKQKQLQLTGKKSYHSLKYAAVIALGLE
jgi:hypothetical protein